MSLLFSLTLSLFVSRRASPTRSTRDPAGLMRDAADPAAGEAQACSSDAWRHGSGRVRCRPACSSDARRGATHPGVGGLLASCSEARRLVCLRCIQSRASCCRQDSQARRRGSSRSSTVRSKQANAIWENQ